MYNSNMPSNEDLPSTGKLIKSTILAALGAGILLVTVVMPAEYSIDPTGVGKIFGLTDMGEIKQSLVLEAKADARAHEPQIELIKEEPTFREAIQDENSQAVEVEIVLTPETEVEVESEPAPQKQNHGHHHGDGSYHRH